MTEEKNVKSLEKALDIIEIVSNEQQDASLSEIARQTGLPKSTVHRLIATLTGRGYLEKTEAGSYKIGLKLFEVVSCYINNLELQTEARPYIAELTSHLGLTSYLGILDGDELIWARMYNTGQVCCASKRFLIHNSLKNEFAEKSVAKIKELNYGDPAKDETQIACLISEKAAIKVEKEVALTVEQGGRIILGGKRDGAFYEPTVIVDVPKTADVAKDMEIFGPVVPIIGFDTDEEAIEIANSSVFGLSSCVFSKDQKRAFKVARAMEAGGAVINGASFFRSFEMPFGGWKHSGIGTEGVMSTFDEMTRVKTIVLKNIID